MPRLDHVTIETRDAPQMIGFLEAVLGVREGYAAPIFHPASSTMSPSAFTNSGRRWNASRLAAIATNITTFPTPISARSLFTAPKA